MQMKAPLAPATRPRRSTLARTTLAGLVLVLTGAFALEAQDTRPIEPEDYYRVQPVSSAELSPDGRYLLYTVQTIRRDQNDRISRIWYTDLQTGTHRPLTTAGASSTNPNWTPDGNRVYFNTRRGDESGIHFINFREPGGEAYRIRGLTGSPNFSPDGSWILVTRQVAAEGAESDNGDEAATAGRGGVRGEAARSRAWDECPFPQGTPGLMGPTEAATRGASEEERNCDVFVIEHASYKRDGTLTLLGPGSGGGGQGGSDRYTQFFRIPADGLAEGEEAEQLTFDEVNKSFQAFSPDGRSILYTVNLTARDRDRDRDEGEEEEEEEDAELPWYREELPEHGIFLLPASGGEPRQVASVPGNVRSVRMSPDGRQISYVLTEERLGDPLIQVIDARTGTRTAEIARDDWNRSIGTPEWSPDGRHLYWTSAVGGQDQVMRARAAGGPVEQVTEGRHSFSGGVSFDAAMQRMAYVKSTAERPWEVFVADIDGRNERQVSSVNEEWLAEVRLSPVERFTYEGVPHNREWLDQLPQRGVDYMMANDAPDGERFEIEAWLVYPIDYEPGRTYPMVVSIHGGPHSRYADTWFPEFQMLAAEGMFVLYTNPRGSSGYGMDFQYATLRAWGIDDTKDILQGVDIAVDRGLADPERLGITGGSYGGFMTSWITAHDQRWRSALTARGIVNWISFYGVSDASGLVEREFGGMPWPFNDDEAGSFVLATKLSPIVWADRVETPTLIIHSINDYRTPLEGGEQWYRALHKHDVPVRMVLFPDSSHGLSRTGEPWLLVRRLHEYMDWFRATLVDAEDVPVTADADA